MSSISFDEIERMYELLRPKSIQPSVSDRPIFPKSLFCRKNIPLLSIELSPIFKVVSEICSKYRTANPEQQKQTLPMFFILPLLCRTCQILFQANQHAAPYSYCLFQYYSKCKNRVRFCDLKGIFFLAKIECNFRVQKAPRFSSFTTESQKVSDVSRSRIKICQNIFSPRH